MARQQQLGLFDTTQKDGLQKGASRSETSPSDRISLSAGGPRGARVLAAVRDYLKGRKTGGKRARRVPDSVPLVPQGAEKGGFHGDTGGRSSPTGTPRAVADDQADDPTDHADHDRGGGVRGAAPPEAAPAPSRPPHGGRRGRAGPEPCISKALSFFHRAVDRWPWPWPWPWWWCGARGGRNPPGRARV